MDGLDRFVNFLRKKQRDFSRRRRMIFPSPAELRVVELMGGKVRRIEWLRDPRTHFPAAFIVTMGPCFRAEKVRREVRIGPYFADFCNDLYRIIEVDGKQFHMDIVADMEREIYIKNYTQRVMGANQEARFLRIPAAEIYSQPDRVQQKILQFLAS